MAVRVITLHPGGRTSTRVVGLGPISGVGLQFGPTELEVQGNLAVTDTIDLQGPIELQGIQGPVGYILVATATGAEWIDSGSLPSSSGTVIVRNDGELTAPVSADANVSTATNVSGSLGSYTLGTFPTNVDVYVNGQLMRNGASVSTDEDVYPGTTPAIGDLRFKFDLLTGDKITVFTRT